MSHEVLWSMERGWQSGFSPKAILRDVGVIIQMLVPSMGLLDILPGEGLGLLLHLPLCRAVLPSIPHGLVWNLTFTVLPWNFRNKVIPDWRTSS